MHLEKVAWAGWSLSAGAVRAGEPDVGAALALGRELCLHESRDQRASVK